MHIFSQLIVARIGFKLSEKQKFCKMAATYFQLDRDLTGNRERISRLLQINWIQFVAFGNFSIKHSGSHI